ncbi:MAG: radical SAM protein [Isosphaeraceae bacterium]
MNRPALARSEPDLPAHRDHSRRLQDNRFVYAVLSRRSRGISIGINLNPDTVCNFDCVYCQVDRRTPPLVREVDEPVLLAELEETLELVQSGELYHDPRFAGVPRALRRLNDIAFSGDGEPTSFPRFAEIMREVAAVKRRRKLDQVKLILITNATLFHRPGVREGLAILDANQGEIWAKLDAGTEAYYHTIERTKVPFERVLTNLRDAARGRPIVIQSLFMTLDGKGPDEAEIDAYRLRLGEILAAGGAISCVQIYTVARTPAEPSVGPLSRAELDRIGLAVRDRLGLAVDVIPGGTSDG